MDLRLSTLGVDDVCNLISRMEDLSQNSVPEYLKVIREHNINGRVLLHCDTDELKKVFLFKIVLISLYVI